MVKPLSFSLSLFSASFSSPIASGFLCCSVRNPASQFGMCASFGLVHLRRIPSCVSCAGDAADDLDSITITKSATGEPTEDGLNASYYWCARTTHVYDSIFCMHHTAKLKAKAMALASMAKKKDDGFSMW